MAGFWPTILAVSPAELTAGPLPRRCVHVICNSRDQGVLAHNDGDRRASGSGIRLSGGLRSAIARRTHPGRLLPGPGGRGTAIAGQGGARYHKRDFWADENLKYAEPHFRMRKVAREVRG